MKDSDTAYSSRFKISLKFVLIRLLILTLTGFVIFALIWQNYHLKHYTIRLLTEMESLTTVAGIPKKRTGDTANSLTRCYIHRARVSQDVSDNSSYAVERAAKRFRSIEIDIAYSSDLIPYISHGDDLSHRAGRTMNHVNKYTTDELNSIIMADGSSLMSLSYFGRFWADAFDGVIIDVKTDHSYAEEKAHNLLRCIEYVGPL